MAIHISTKTEPMAIQPNNGQHFTLAELQHLVNGHIEMIYLPSCRIMVVNEEGRINGSEKNEIASAIWRAEFPADEYPNNNPGDVFGAVLIAKPEEID